MAHSRIIQVTKNRIDKSEWLKAVNLDLELLRCEIDFIDYVVDAENREEDLKWLKGQLKRVGFSLRGKKILISDKTDFLDKWKETAIEAVEDFNLYKMQRIASGVYFSSFYIYDEDFGYPIPLWEWAKEVVGTGKTFYVGGIIDYHY